VIDCFKDLICHDCYHSSCDKPDECWCGQKDYNEWTDAKKEKFNTDVCTDNLARFIFKKMNALNEKIEALKDTYYEAGHSVDYIKDLLELLRDKEWVRQKLCRTL